MLLFLDIVTVTLLGLILGSFSTALIYRIPKHLSWTVERSICTACNNTLGVIDLIPVFSWLLSGGKCRHCKVSVSYTYPLIEVVSAVLCLCVYAVFGLTAEAFIIFAALPFLLALFVIDLKHMILPNQLVLIVLIIGVIRLFHIYLNGNSLKAEDIFFTYITGALFYALIPWLSGLIMTKVLKKESLGFGDVKFFFVAGVWLGFDYLPFFLILSGSGAIIFAILWKYFRKKEVFPFGPALIISFFGLLLLQGSFL